ncbi:hypothetical protein DSUL_40115 [Desulfovibrionales bacterium]
MYTTYKIYPSSKLDSLFHRNSNEGIGIQLTVLPQSQAYHLRPPVVSGYTS